MISLWEAIALAYAGFGIGYNITQFGSTPTPKIYWKGYGSSSAKHVDKWWAIAAFIFFMCLAWPFYFSDTFREMFEIK